MEMIDKINDFVKTHYVFFDEKPEPYRDGVKFVVDGVPTLGWLLDLAEALEVNPRDIVTQSWDNGGGCETCGHGGGQRFEAYIPAVRRTVE
jgi:hypothetical protein